MAKFLENKGHFQKRREEAASYVDASLIEYIDGHLHYNGRKVRRGTPGYIAIKHAETMQDMAGEIFNKAVHTKVSQYSTEKALGRATRTPDSIFEKGKEDKNNKFGGKTYQEL